MEFKRQLSAHGSSNVSVSVVALCWIWSLGFVLTSLLHLRMSIVASFLCGPLFKSHTFQRSYVMYIDFTRHAKSQADQIVGQVGLPVFMGAFTFLGLAVTSSTEVIFGRVISNPIEVLGKIGGIVPISLSIFGVALATLTTNIAANVVAPANALANLSPSWFTFKRGTLLTAILGILCQPWRLLQSSESFIYTWLVGYSALLGPIAGIILVDYFILRGRVLDIDALYSCNPHGQYWYYRGYNISALVSLLVGMAPVVPGFLHTVGLLNMSSPSFLILYNNSWFVSFFIAGLAYWALSRFQNIKQSEVIANTYASPQDVSKLEN